MAKIKHIALFKFKEGTAQEQIDQVLDQILELSESIDGIEDYVGGINNSVEGLNQGFTHGFVMTFKDETSLKNYGKHPVHQQAVKDVLRPLVERYVIYDFTAKH